MSDVFSSLCGYCEKHCKGDVDHFRPKSRDPELVYAWENWVLSCGPCNNKKGSEWPKDGYVDPCKKSNAQRPEAYFDFDAKVGDILPKQGLGATRKRRAETMIKDLGLNAFHHLKARARWLEIISLALAGRAPNDPNVLALANLVASRESRLSSITRVWLQENGFSFD